ncbi:MAG: hypothetical protein WD025_02500 [Bacteriovoracaceae bacterium]
MEKSLLNFKSRPLDERSSGLLLSNRRAEILRLCFLPIIGGLITYAYLIKINSLHVEALGYQLKTNDFAAVVVGAAMLIFMSFVVSYVNTERRKSQLERYWKDLQINARKSWFERIVESHDFLWCDLFNELGGDLEVYHSFVEGGIVNPITGGVLNNAKESLAKLVSDFGSFDEFMNYRVKEKKSREIKSFAKNEIDFDKDQSLASLEAGIGKINIKKVVGLRSGVLFLEEVSGGLIDGLTFGGLSAAVAAPGAIKKRKRILTYMHKVFPSGNYAEKRAKLEFHCDVVLPTAGKVVGGSVGGAVGASAGTAIAATLADGADKSTKALEVGAAAGAAGAAGGISIAGAVATIAPFALGIGGAVIGGIFIGNIFKKYALKKKVEHLNKLKSEFTSELRIFYQDQVEIFLGNDSETESVGLGLIKKLELEYGGLKSVLEAELESCNKTKKIASQILNEKFNDHPLSLVLGRESEFIQENLSFYQREFHKINGQFLESKNMAFKEETALELFEKTAQVKSFKRNEEAFQRLKEKEKVLKKEVALFRARYQQDPKKAA